MSRPLLLDLFCGAGGAAMGYHRAGFDVVGVDIVNQPHYPFEFVLGDALDAPLLLTEARWDGVEFAAIHASPPCQLHVKGLRATNERLGRPFRHADLIAKTRSLLKASGLPFVIENVEAAPLIDPVRLCGTSFGLPLRRHRVFESSLPLMVPPCNHGAFREKRYWTGWVKDGERVRATTVQVYGNGGETHEWPAAMGIDWMTRQELQEAIPPAYAEHIGSQLIEQLERVA